MCECVCVCAYSMCGSPRTPYESWITRPGSRRPYPLNHLTSPCHITFSLHLIILHSPNLTSRVGVGVCPPSPPLSIFPSFPETSPLGFLSETHHSTTAQIRVAEYKQMADPMICQTNPQSPYYSTSLRTSLTKDYPQEQEDPK